MRVRQRLLASGVTTLASTTSSWSSCLKSRRPEEKKGNRVMMTIKSESRGAEQHLVSMTRKVGASPVEQRRKVQPACGCHNFYLFKSQAFFYFTYILKYTNIFPKLRIFNS